MVEEQIQYPWRGFSHPGDNFYQRGDVYDLPSIQFKESGIIIKPVDRYLLHIFFNMVAFRQLASFVLREYGPHRFVVLYTLTGIAGFWVSYLAAVPLTIGASAAVCGLIGASLYYGKSRGGVYGQAIYKQVGGWAIGIFVFGFLLSGISNWANVPSINNWAHGGGIAAGVILGFLLGYRERKQEMFWHRYLAFGCVLITVVALAWAIAIGAYFRFA